MARKFRGRPAILNGLASLCVALAALGGTAGAQHAQDVFAPFADLLTSAVEDGVVDYAAFARSQAFDDMMQRLATTAPARDADKNERLAFYINAYNATSIQTILDGYSPATIWSRIRFFKRRKYDLFNTSISLYDLEHERIINEGDPRIHFAIVCSSKSCPPLQNTLYRAETLDSQLDEVTRRFINNPASNSFDLASRSATLSRIFDWYDDEFADAGGSLQNFLASYADDPALRASLAGEDWEFDFMDYDWSLNGIPLKP